MKHPLLAAAVAYAAGVVLGEWVPTDLAALLAASAAVWIAALVHARSRPWLLLPLLLLAGWTVMSLSHDVTAPQDLRNLLGDRPTAASLRGTLVDNPASRPFLTPRGTSWRSTALINVTAIRRRATWEPATGRVAVTAPGLLDPAWHRGLPVELSGALAPPRNAVAPDLFDHRNHLRHLGVHFLLRSESTVDWQLRLPPHAPPPRPPLDVRFSRWARQTLALGLPVEDDSLRLLWAMTLGWKPGLTDEISEPFLHSGTLHVFAISGLHVALIAEILVHLLCFLRLPRAAAGLIALPLLWFYTGATGWQPSAVRSAIMMTLVIGGWALHRPPNLLNSLMAAALIVLAFDPHQLFQAGFQLSFSVVLSIALILPPIDALRQRLVAPDPLLPHDLRPRWQRWLDTPIQFLTCNAALALAAWLGSVPLVASLFHLCTPVSLLANLLVVPLSSLALTSALGSLLCGQLLPTLTTCFNHSAWFWMESMVTLSTWSASLPGASFPVPSPGLPLSLAWYLAVLGPAAGLLRHRQPRTLWMLALLALTTLAATHHLRQRSHTQLTLLDCGGGDALWIDQPGLAQDLLVDCGNEYAAPFRLLPFLQARGVQTVRHLLLTHGDTRHLSGALPLLDSHPVRQVALSTVRQRSPILERILNTARSRQVPVAPVQRGDSLAGWTVLHPSAHDRPRRADDHAVVLQRIIHGTPVLLCSDLSPDGVNLLLQRERPATGGILIAGMPNGPEPLPANLLDAVQPAAVILSCGNVPASERPTWPLRARLLRRHLPVFYTADSGTVTLTLHPGGWHLRTMQGEELHGRPPPPP